MADRMGIRKTARARRRRLQAGQGLVEYGLILLLVAVAVVVALTALQSPLKTIFDTIKNDLTAA